MKYIDGKNPIFTRPRVLRYVALGKHYFATQSVSNLIESNTDEESLMVYVRGHIGFY